MTSGEQCAALDEPLHVLHTTAFDLHHVQRSNLVCHAVQLTLYWVLTIGTVPTLIGVTSTGSKQQKLRGITEHSHMQQLLT